MSDVQCRHGCNVERNPAVARYAMTKGCVCFPNDVQQDLCLQHAMRASPLGRMELIRVYRQDILDAYERSFERKAT